MSCKSPTLLVVPYGISCDVTSIASNSAVWCKREIIKIYASKLHEVIVKTASKVAESVGLVGYSFDDWTCQLRINKYNFTKESVGSSGLQIHTDSGFLTLLQEDEFVGGLEVVDKSGTLVAVDPVPDSFLVNIGDVGQAWSNGRLHSVKHRVQCKEAGERISVGLFLLGPKDDKVELPSVFVDAEHPRIYKDFNYSDYRKLRHSTGYIAGPTPKNNRVRRGPDSGSQS